MADLSRRKLLRGAVASAAMIPLVHLETRSAHAAEAVPVDDPTAQALGYVEDATTASRMDKAEVPGAEQFCSNCDLYKGEGESAPCSLFQNRLVKGAGWCMAWVPQR